MSDEDTLRRAADAVKRAASETTPGPWEWDEHVGGDGFVVLGGGCRRGHFPAIHDGGQMPDAMWAAFASPVLADPLVSWLKSAADALHDYPGAGDPDSSFTKILMADGQPHAYRHTVAFVRGALGVARALLGEQVPA